MRIPLLLALSLTTSCAEGTLDAADPLVFDGATDVPVWSLVDGNAADAAVVDAPAVDAPAVDAPAVDARADAAVVDATDVPPAVDVRPLDAPAVTDAGALVDVHATPDAPDVPVVVDVPADLPVVPADTGWGDGPAGYRVSRDDSAATWVDACAQPGHQTVLTNADDGSFRATLPFRFRYWGRALEAGAPVVITPNGYLSFQADGPTPANGIIPNHLDGIDAVVAVQWRDLNTRSPGVCIALVGNAGSRRWVVGWSDVHYYTSSLGHLNFEIVLDEGSNAIDFVYDNMTLVEPATVALEDWDGARSSVPFTVPQPIVFSNTRARFIPQ